MASGTEYLLDLLRPLFFVFGLIEGVFVVVDVDDGSLLGGGAVVLNCVGVPIHGDEFWFCGQGFRCVDTGGVTTEGFPGFCEDDDWWFLNVLKGDVSGWVWYWCCPSCLLWLRVSMQTSYGLELGADLE